RRGPGPRSWSGRTGRPASAARPWSSPESSSRTGRRSSWSQHLDVGLQGAGGLDGLQDRDDVARGHAEGVEAVDQFLQRGGSADHDQLFALLLLDLDVALGGDGGAALAEGQG